MSRFTQWPARELVIVARHDTIGDERFCPKVDRALLELIASYRGCELDNLRATNGVYLEIKSVPMIHPEEIRPDDKPGHITDLPDERLQLAYQAVSDQHDSLDAIEQAMQDGDISEALRLIKIARESLTEHIDTLRGLL